MDFLKAEQLTSVKWSVNAIPFGGPFAIPFGIRCDRPCGPYGIPCGVPCDGPCGSQCGPYGSPCGPCGPCGSPFDSPCGCLCGSPSFIIAGIITA